MNLRRPFNTPLYPFDHLNPMKIFLKEGSSELGKMGRNRTSRGRKKRMRIKKPSSVLTSRGFGGGKGKNMGEFEDSKRYELTKK